MPDPFARILYSESGILGTILLMCPWPVDFDPYQVYFFFPKPVPGTKPHLEVSYLVGFHLVVADRLEAGPDFILNIWWLLLALNISPYNCTIEFHLVFVGPCFQFVVVVLNFILGSLSVSQPTKFSIM